MDIPAVSAPRRHRRPWALSFFGLLAVAGVIAMPILAGPPNGGKMPDWVRFLGHFHPVLLHLPIGVLALILLQELGAIFFRRTQEPHRAPLFPTFFLAASAVLAVLAGFLLYHGGGFESNPTAERHLWGGLAFAVLAVLTFLARAWTAGPESNPAVFRLLLFVSAGVMGFASHDGASLTHGETYLTDHAPDPIRKLLGLPVKTAPATQTAVKPVGERLAYADVVAPILEQRCVSCHKEGKSKGGVKMDTYGNLVKGAKGGPVLIAGNAAKSHMVELVSLPGDDPDHMPPRGLPQMTADELLVLKWWIDKGADGAKTVKDLDPAPEITAVLDKLGPAAATAGTPRQTPAPATPPADAGPDAALKAAVDGLAKEFPGAVAFESQQSSAVTLNAASLRGTLDDAAFAKLAPVLPHVVTADLSATKLTDQGIAALATARNLRLVRLAETQVTDASIDTLLKIPALESLNLYGTRITDAGAVKLAGLPNLKRLYLWQTAVTPAAIGTLKEKLPKCEIVTGT